MSGDEPPERQPWFVSLTLILLGLGWNFGFVGASALVLACHRREEKTRVQSFNDFVVFGTMAIGSFASGGMLAAYNWDTVLWVSFVLLAPVVIALAVSAMSSTPAVAVQEHRWEACPENRRRGLTPPRCGPTHRVLSIRKRP